MAKEYSDFGKEEEDKSDMTKSLVIQKERSDKLLLNSLNDKFGFTIRENDTNKFYWDLLILIIAIFNSIFIPVALSFNQINDDLNESVLYKTIDIASTVFFIIDIFF
jgi:hypothetical protein